jgi:hypothetical protein
MESHQQRRSQCRSTHHRLRLDTNTGTSGPTNQDTNPPTIHRQVASTDSGQDATTSHASGRLSPLLQVPGSVPIATPRSPNGLSPIIDLDNHSSVHVSMASLDDVPRSSSHSQFRGTPISLFPAVQEVEHLSDSIMLPEDSLPVPVIEVNVPQVDDPVAQLLLQGFQSMFAKQEQDRIADRIERHRFEATVHGLLNPSPGHGSGSDASPNASASAPVSIGQYYPASPIHPEPQPRASTLFPSAQVEHHRVPESHGPYRSTDVASHLNEPPFITALTKTSHCSKFKKHLEDSVSLASDSLTSLEFFVDGIKSALDMALCSHYSFLPYNESALDYLVTTTLCPPTLRGHPRYSSMCINFNAFGLVLHRFMWSRAPITFSRSPSAYHELNVLRHVTCGWTLFQELIWACSPHMNGSF